MNTVCRLAVVLLAGLSALVQPAGAQIGLDEPRLPPTPAQRTAASQAFLASRKLQLEIGLDRQEYFAGESGRATLSVFNPTQGSLVVFDPFDRGAGCLDLHVWYPEADPGSEWRMALVDEDCSGLDLSAPTITLGPGQRIEKTVPSAGSDWALPLPRVSAGRYRMSFCCRSIPATCAHAEFTVFEPIFRGYAAVRLTEPSRVRNPRTGAETQYPRHLRAFILEYDGKRYIGLARNATTQSEVYLNVDQKLNDGNALGLGTYDRIEAGADANSIQIAADAQENITLTWKENGQRKSHCASNDRTRIAPCDASPGATR